jgi:hypothetical protein
MKTESLGKSVPRSVPQITQKCNTTSGTFVNTFRHFSVFKATDCSLLIFDKVTLHLVEVAEKYNLTQYCFLSSTTYEILLWISQCSEFSNALEMKKCPVTHLNNKCEQLRSYDLQKSSLLRGINQWLLSYFDLMQKMYFSLQLIIAHHALKSCGSLVI